jgi:hypothetical protein
MRVAQGTKLALAVVIALLVAAPALRGATLAEAKIFIEFNDSDQDIGVHVFLDGEWQRIRILDPQGQQIFHVFAQGALVRTGLSELFVEGEEPTLDELPLDEFFELFPEGEYLFTGKDEEGATIKTRVEFSHLIPEGPNVHAPVDGVPVDRAHVIVSWDPVTGTIAGDPADLEIEAYEVIIDSSSFIVGADVTSLAVPPEVLEAGTDHGFEVIAVDASGNQTITEGDFQTTH